MQIPLQNTFYEMQPLRKKTGKTFLNFGATKFFHRHIFYFVQKPWLTYFGAQKMGNAWSGFVFLLQQTCSQNQIKASSISTPKRNSLLSGLFSGSSSSLESLNLREGQPQPGTSFGLSPLLWGMVWNALYFFSFKIWEQAETTMLPVAKVFPKCLKLVHRIYLSMATLQKWRQRPYT